jgi:parallel beta-helix repeat protein
MRKRKGFSIKAVRLFCFALLGGALFWGTGYVSNVNVSANHPVLVEGNCDSPVPGTTLVSPGTCGDFDGDGRIGTAEDTDGADRIFGTINAAIGPGTGAAAGTGANHNGTITIVTSGRFAEALYIGQSFTGPGGVGIASPGNVTLEAAPGVNADINAVLQGDPAGGNTARQSQPGIAISYLTNADSRVVTLRNLVVRNFDVGIWANNASKVIIENCRVENNLNAGIRVSNTARAVISKSTVTATGFRIPATGTLTVGNGIWVEQSAQARIADSTSSHNFLYGIANSTGNPANVVLFKTGSYFNGTGDLFNVSIAPNPNSAN